MLEEYEDSGTTQKKDVKKKPAKMLPSTLSKHCMYTGIVAAMDSKFGTWKLNFVAIVLSGQFVF